MMSVFVLLLLASSLCFSQSPYRQQIVDDLFPQISGPPLSTTPRTEPEFFQEPAAEKKSIALAGVYSLLLPGMGELYAGNYSTGKYFTIAEGMLWITLGAVNWQANSLRDDARNFAVQHAGVSLDNKDDTYFVNIGNYNNTNSYNTAFLRGREYFKTYDAQSAYAWQWDVDVNRTYYRDLRVASDEMFNNTRFVVGVIALNHLISAINAGRIALAHNKSLDRAELIDVRASLIGTPRHPDGMMVSFTKRF